MAAITWTETLALQQPRMDRTHREFILDPAVTRPPAAPAAASVARWQVQCGR
jgi:hypothetical protein